MYLKVERISKAPSEDRVGITHIQIDGVSKWLADVQNYGKAKAV